MAKNLVQMTKVQQSSHSTKSYCSQLADVAKRSDYTLGCTVQCRLAPTLTTHLNIQNPLTAKVLVIPYDPLQRLLVVEFSSSYTSKAVL